MAKRVRFLRDYDLSTSPRRDVAYKKGHEDTLPDDQADAVIAKGIAELITDKTPSKRDKAPG